MAISAIIFLLGTLLGCVWAFTRHPIYGLLTYLGVFYIHPPGQWWGGTLPELRWSLIVAVITLVATIVRRPPAGPRRPSLLSQPVLVGFLVFCGWLAVQLLWAMEPDLQVELLIMFLKYAVLLGVVIVCVDSEKNLKLFLWAHVVGAGYLGLRAYFSYEGGRFEGFPVPGLNEANSAALHMATAVVTGAALFLLSGWRGRLALLGILPFTANTIIATISRSGFLAILTGGVSFNLFTPKRFRLGVRLLSMLAIVMFALLTNPLYWARIASLKHAGEEVEGVDTGAGRLVLVQAQWRMFKEHPFGCGHRCTATLSSQYLEDKDLTGPEGHRARSSHNTFMSLLVEQGIPGVAMYLALLLWMYRELRRLWARLKGTTGTYAILFPGIAAALMAIPVGDMFVDYLKLEVRVWFIGIAIALSALTAQLPSSAPAAEPARKASAAGPPIGRSRARRE